MLLFEINDSSSIILHGSAIFFNLSLSLSFSLFLSLSLSFSLFLSLSLSHSSIPDPPGQTFCGTCSRYDRPLDPKKAFAVERQLNITLQPLLGLRQYVIQPRFRVCLPCAMLFDSQQGE